MPRSDVRILLKMGALALSNVYLDSSSKVHQTVQSHTTVTMVASIKKLKNVFVKLAVIRVTKMSKMLATTVQMTTKRSLSVQSTVIQALFYKALATQLNVPTTKLGVEIGQFVYLMLNLQQQLRNRQQP